MLATASTVILPPLPKIGPGNEGDEMVWFLPEHAASARSGAARAARATSEAPASSAAREIRAPPPNVEMLERRSPWRARPRRPLFFTPMTPFSRNQSVFYLHILLVRKAVY